MKKWFYQQLTEVTAWVGFYLCISSFFYLPWWVDFCVGILLISIDDVKAAAWVKARAPWIQKQIDSL